MKRQIIGIVLGFALPAWAGGTLAGTVTLKGPLPKPLAKLERTDPVCKGLVDDPSFIVAKDGKGLVNAQVRVLDAPAGAVPTEVITVDQKGCMYQPHVQGAVEGQKISIKNSDLTMHNVHAWGKQDGKEKALFNVAQPPGPRLVERDPKASDVVKLKCDVHPWMSAYVVYSKNPYFATTDAQGKFEIKNIPPGEYTVEAWHERLGTVTAKVKVVEGKSVDPKLALKK